MTTGDRDSPIVIPPAPASLLMDAQQQPLRHSGAGPPAWMQVVEQRREQAAEESSGLIKTFPQRGNDNTQAR